jgi:FlaG/FlaF family flagellin (archaellin)
MAIIGEGAGAMAIIWEGAGAMAIIGEGAGPGAIVTILAGAPESMTLGLVVTRVTRPTPTRALSTGRGEPVTFGPLL